MLARNFMVNIYRMIFFFHSLWLCQQFFVERKKSSISLRDFFFIRFSICKAYFWPFIFTYAVAGIYVTFTYLCVSVCLFVCLFTFCFCCWNLVSIIQNWLLLNHRCIWINVRAHAAHIVCEMKSGYDNVRRLCMRNSICITISTLFTKMKFEFQWHEIINMSTNKV